MDPSTSGSFVVVKSGTALRGLDLFVALHICIEGSKVVTVTSPKNPPAVQRAPKVPSTYRRLGVHKIQLKPDADQKLRRCPFSVRQAVTDELNDL